jgi:hypothetical protein
MLLGIIAFTSLLCTVCTWLRATTLPPSPLACITSCCLLLLLFHRHSILHISIIIAIVVVIPIRAVIVPIDVVIHVSCHIARVEGMGAGVEGTCRDRKVGGGMMHDRRE